ncbi:MAG TPA: FAD-dependent oxidoreductase [Gaiellaceae bacterium]|jgi:sarcosine oxidase|nr:FAD-dependent oxidoreductase [Gaiellaceae bacterium]
MVERVDVAVVGGGVMGLATAWALRRAGREPVVLEQFRVGDTHGSSHGATRIFRLAYAEEEWVRLAQEALVLWRELEAETGEPALDLVGLLDLADDPAPLAAALDACGTAYELLSAGEAEQRFGLATQCRQVLFQPEAGVVLADRAIRGFAAGVEVREQIRVTSLEPLDESVRVNTERGALEASDVVVAGGAWAKQLLPDLPVIVTRETVAYFRLSDDRTVPSVIDYAAGETYALTAGPGLLKVGLHHSGPQVDPDDGAGEPDDAVVAREAEWAARSWPLASPQPERVETCLYTSTVDHRFVIERHDRVVVCSACSGHGFKFAPAVGTRAAALTLGR